MKETKKSRAIKNTPIEEVNAALSQMTGQSEDYMTPDAAKQDYIERVKKVEAGMHHSSRGNVTKDLYSAYKAVTETPGLDKLFSKNTLTGNIITRYDYSTRKYGEDDIFIKAGTKIEEEHIVSISRRMNATYITDFGLDRIRQAITESANKRQFNPIMDYLKLTTWDGAPRIDTWLIDYAHAEDCPYIRAVSRKWLMQCCARVVEPGCEADCVLVLEGSQGCGKNCLMAALIPNPDWSVSLHSECIDKDAVVSLEGKWIGEFPEMLTGSKSDQNRLKAFISQRNDNYRKAFRRDHKDKPRLTIFYGTTNETKYLQDETGNRRWWPVPVEGFIQIEQTNDGGKPLLFLDRDGLRNVRDQIWAEALVRVQRGESFKLTADESAAAEVIHLDRMSVDPWEKLVANYLAKVTIDRNIGLIPEFLLGPAVVGVDPSKQTPGELKRLYKVLRKLGFDNKLVRQDDGKRVRRWVKI